jgi:hypothetical protein
LAIFNFFKSDSVFALAFSSFAFSLSFFSFFSLVSSSDEFYKDSAKFKSLSLVELSSDYDSNSEEKEIKLFIFIKQIKTIMIIL